MHGICFCGPSPQHGIRLDTPVVLTAELVNHGLPACRQRRTAGLRLPSAGAATLSDGGRRDDGGRSQRRRSQRRRSERRRRAIAATSSCRGRRRRGWWRRGRWRGRRRGRGVVGGVPRLGLRRR